MRTEHINENGIGSWNQDYPAWWETSVDLNRLLNETTERKRWFEAIGTSVFRYYFPFDSYSWLQKQGEDCLGECFPPLNWNTQTHASKSHGRLPFKINLYTNPENIPPNDGMWRVVPWNRNSILNYLYCKSLEMKCFSLFIQWKNGDIWLSDRWLL